MCEFLEEQCGVLRLDPFTEIVPRKPTLTLAAPKAVRPEPNVVVR